ncbi:phosphatidate cytidylyltransferase [Collinsella sp. An2]|uniref:phosphatidate cytidylyltransferase n=1 Tax=Collinsella sp. An2 TaxID=1965585 RepID=UPI001EF65F40|nr:phosphatidate cytidylyltransferase [Collinsella sp. An2]
MESSEHQTNRPEQTSGQPAEAGKGSALARFMTRVVSGLIYVGLFIGCLLGGTLSTAIFMAVVSWICCSEFFDMMRRDGKVPNAPLGLVAAALFPLAALGDSYFLSAALFLLVLSVGLWYVYSPRCRISDVSVTLMGPIYTGYMLSSVVLLRDAIPGFPGALLTVGVCASLWVSDSFAYLVGSKIGRHKLVPKISPHKSWEGFFGGILGSVIVWCILFATGFFRMDLWYAVLCGVVVSVLGVFGDLIESRIKRGVGVKDSGTLIPGHGGMLDRNDSLIFGAITAQLLLIIGGVI